MARERERRDGAWLDVIRVGSITAQASRIAATIRGTVDRLAGYRRAVIHMDARSDSLTSNEEVLASLAKRNPPLLGSLDAAARAGISREWKGARSTLANITYHAGTAIARELATRLRSGEYVTNTEATRRAKARDGRSQVPGISTGQLAVALDNARIEVE